MEDSETQTFEALVVAHKPVSIGCNLCILSVVVVDNQIMKISFSEVHCVIIAECYLSLLSYLHWQTEFCMYAV